MTHRRDQGGFSLLELVIVVAIITAIAAMAIPNFLTMMRGMRIAGDARSINGVTGQVKMRAAADFTQARLFLNMNPLTNNLTNNSFRIDVWNKGLACWVPDGVPPPPAAANCVSDASATPQDVPLSQGVIPGFGGVGASPTGAAIAQAPACLNDTNQARPGLGAAIGNTACIVFNSRGVPVDNTNKATPNDAIYLTDGVTVYGVTVDIGGLIKTWRVDANGTTWQQR